MQENKSLKAITEYFSLAPDNDAKIADSPVTGVTSDSRKVADGYVFFAWRGGNFDSHQFIQDAVERGAIAVVGTEYLAHPIPVPYFRVEDSRYWLAGFAAYLHDFPAGKLNVIGVTGTDGKTTTTNFIYNILLAAGIHAGMVSTVNAVIGDRVIDTGFHVTTPEAPEVQQYLDEMVKAGVTHVVLEATSHGLAQQRVAFCEFDQAVVTNITHEHLDYHGSYDGYLASKAKLFEYVAGRKDKPHAVKSFVVLNKEDRSYPVLENISQDVNRIKYGLSATADLWASAITNTDDGIDFVIHYGEDTFPFHTHLKGDFNVLNCLAAIGITHFGLGIDYNTVQKGLDRVKSLIGRMEEIKMGQEFRAFVDFAHTPFGLEAALKSARKMTKGRVIAVFGSAGLRDRLKRRMMAEMSADLADVTVLTAEDPRTESLEGILEKMAAAMQAKGKIEGTDYYRVPDRGQAIRKAVALAQPGDLVIACGKGHEQSMCFGTTEYAWDEKTAMQAALGELLNVAAPKMPYLPTQEN